MKWFKSFFRENNHATSPLVELERKNAERFAAMEDDIFKLREILLKEMNVQSFLNSQKISMI